VEQCERPALAEKLIVDLPERAIGIAAAGE
jgi:hypothetical protein